jgi:hypothetical protein
MHWCNVIWNCSWVQSYHGVCVFLLMYVCVYVCTCVCTAHLGEHSYVTPFKGCGYHLRQCMHERACLRMYVSCVGICTCLHVHCANTCVGACTGPLPHVRCWNHDTICGGLSSVQYLKECVCRHSRMCVCMYAWMHVCIYDARTGGELCVHAPHYM